MLDNEFKVVKLCPIDVDYLFRNATNKLTNYTIRLTKDIEPKKDLLFKSDIIENERILYFKDLVTRIESQSIESRISEKRELIPFDGEINDSMYYLVKNLFAYTGNSGVRKVKKSSVNENNETCIHSEMTDIDLYEVKFFNLVPELVYLFMNEPYDDNMFWMGIDPFCKKHSSTIFENIIYKYDDPIADKFFDYLLNNNEVFMKFKYLMDKTYINIPCRVKIPEVYTGIKYNPHFKKSRLFKTIYNPDMAINNKKDLMILYIKALILPLYAMTMFIVTKKSPMSITIRSLSHMKFILDIPKGTEERYYKPIIDMGMTDIFGKEIYLIPEINKLTND